LLTDRQTNKQTKSGKNITSLAEVINASGPDKSLLLSKTWHFYPAVVTTASTHYSRVELVACLNTKVAYRLTVTHLNTNPAQCRVASLM